MKKCNINFFLIFILAILKIIDIWSAYFIFANSYSKEWNFFARFIVNNKYLVFFLSFITVICFILANYLISSYKLENYSNILMTVLIFIVFLNLIAVLNNLSIIFLLIK